MCHPEQQGEASVDADEILLETQALGPPHGELDLVRLEELPLPLGEDLAHRDVLGDSSLRDGFDDLHSNGLFLLLGQYLISYETGVDQHHEGNYLEAELERDVTLD